MKKAATLLLACTLAFYGYSQQSEGTTQSQKNDSEEKTSAFLGTIGGMSAAYILTAQDHIETQIKTVERNRADSALAIPKLTVQKNICNLLQEQLNKLQSSNAIGPDSPDHSFIVDLKTTLSLIIKEVDLGISYIRDNSSNKKTQYDNSSLEASKKIKELLGME
ncbi:MAG: hypothetical protein ABW007_07160 [Chitinophagaceae bacterium]